MADNEDQWHINPKLMIAVLGWLVTASLGGFAWAVNVSSELAVHKALISQLREDNVRQDVSSLEASRAVKEELREVRAEIRALREVLQRRNGQ